MLATDALREAGDSMSPAQAREMKLLATDDPYLANQEWRRGVFREIDRHEPKDK